ncbi:MAG: dTMP kinase [Acidimicrobiia bacterium]|nr:dTMP kinase [Acidimicrobiia bacterium]
MSARYIALEGIEGAGKSTVARLLGRALEGQGHEVVLVREPGGTPTGEAIREVLLHPDGVVAPWTEAMLFAASRAQLAAEVIGPALARGAWVIGDRSVYSSLAYQGGGRELGVDVVADVNRAGLAGVWPDLVVVLDVDPHTGLDRQDDADRIGSEGVDFQAAVAGTFAAMAVDDPERFVVVDASLPVDDVVEAILDGIEQRW